MTKPITGKNLVLGQGMPKICVPLRSRQGSASEEAKKPTAGAELVGVESGFL